MTLTSDLIGFGNLSAALILLGGCSGPRVSATETRATPSQEDLAGTWVARPSHQGESSVLALDLERSGAAGLLARWSTPALDIWDLPLGPAKVHENGIQVGPLALTYDRSVQTLSGILPDALVPVYAIPAVFRRSPPLQRTDRREAGSPSSHRRREVPLRLSRIRSRDRRRASLRRHPGRPRACPCPRRRRTHLGVPG